MALEPWERGECIAHVSKTMESHSPGPAYYNIDRTFGNKVPVILCKGRTFLRPDRIDAPLYNFPSLVGNVPPQFGSEGHKIVIAPIGTGGKVRGKGEGRAGQPRNPNKTVGPGPGKYSLREHSFDATGQKGYTIKGFHDFKYRDTISPGSGAYRPKFEAVLPKAPKVAFHDRPKMRGAPETPGYRNLGSALGGHKFTMKARATDEIQVI
jgi:hypothetical protein